MRLYIKIGIYAVILIALVIMGIVARNEDLPPQMEEEQGVSKAIYRIGGMLYRTILRRRRAMQVTKIKKDLGTITPTNKGEAQVAEFYIRKTGMSIILIGAGCVIAMIISIQSYQKTELPAEGKIPRSEYGGLNSRQELVAQDADGQTIGNYDVSVEARKYTPAELDQLEKELTESLPQMIRGQNKSLEEVHTNLNLMTSVLGYPFTISWSSDDYKLINHSGKLDNGDVPESGQVVELMAKMTAQEAVYEELFTVTVYPPVLTGQQIIDKEMAGLIEADDQKSSTDPFLQLPGEYKGNRIIWKKPVRDSGVIFLLLAITGGVLVYFIKDEQLKEQVRSREEEMVRFYPQLISKLVLYLGAGMTVRGIFEKMCVDYEKELARGMPKRYTYEEIRVMVNELRSGESEGRAYEMFGLRCRCQPYTRLVNLLTQNLRKGNSSLLPLLKSEATKASEERLNIARKAGEKVTTRLLMPMMMLLGIVMIIIMYPAFRSF